MKTRTSKIILSFIILGIFIFPLISFAKKNLPVGSLGILEYYENKKVLTRTIGEKEYNYNYVGTVSFDSTLDPRGISDRVFYYRDLAPQYLGVDSTFVGLGNNDKVSRIYDISKGNTGWSNECGAVTQICEDRVWDWVDPGRGSYYEIFGKVDFKAFTSAKGKEYNVKVLQILGNVKGAPFAEANQNNHKFDMSSGEYSFTEGSLGLVAKDNAATFTDYARKNINEITIYAYAKVDDQNFQAKKTLKMTDPGFEKISDNKYRYKDQVPLTLEKVDKLDKDDGSYWEDEITSTITSPLNTALANSIMRLIEVINETVKNLANWVNMVLLKASEIQDMHKAWLVIRDTSLSLLTLGIVIIAFANVLNLDIEKYGLQRIIPKLVIGVLLTYFSFLISKIFLEAADVLQTQFNSSLSTVSGASGQIKAFELDVEGYTTEMLINNLAQWIFLIVLFIGVIISLIYLALVLLARIVVIKFLVVVAPVAFVLGIMPFTESLSKRWWSTFSQWAFMGPAVMGMILIGSIITKNVPVKITPEVNSVGLNFIDGTVGVIIAAIAYFLAAQIPMMMAGEAKAALGKWSGMVSKAHKRIPGYKTAEGVWNLRKSDKERRVANRALMTRAKLGQIPGMGRLAGYGSNIERETAKTRMQNAIAAERAGFIKDLGKPELDEKLKKLHATNINGRNDRDIQAVMRTVADKGLLENKRLNEDGTPNELFDMQQHYMTKFATDGALFGAAVKENAAAAIYNEKTRPVALASTKKKELKAIDDNTFNAIKFVDGQETDPGKRVIGSYTYDNVKRALEHGDPRLLKAITDKENMALFSQDAQRAFIEKGYMQGAAPATPANQNENFEGHNDDIVDDSGIYRR